MYVGDAGFLLRRSDICVPVLRGQYGVLCGRGGRLRSRCGAAGRERPPVSFRLSARAGRARHRAGGVRLLSGEVPSRMSRMEAVARTWTGSEPLLVMDTGPAAILGALDDGRV